MAIFGHMEWIQIWKSTARYNSSLKKNPFIFHLSVRVHTDSCINNMIQGSWNLGTNLLHYQSNRGLFYLIKTEHTYLELSICI